MNTGKQYDKTSLSRSKTTQ